jgi:hypothetical protein
MSCTEGLEDVMLAAARGAPRQGDGPDVDAHLAACASCRMSMALFRAEGPLPPIDDDDRAVASRLVARTLAPRAVPSLPPTVVLSDGGADEEDDAAMAARLVSRAMAPPRESAGRARRPIPRWAAVAAAIVLTAGAASAALWTGKRFLESRHEAPSAPAESHGHARGHGTSASGPIEPSAAPTVVGVPAVAPVQSAVVPVPSVPGRTPPRRASAAPPALPAAAHASADTPDSLLRAANDARRARRLDEASRGYAALQARFPTSREAIVSHLSRGNLALGGGELALALAEFEAYLATGATDLEEEALLGKARALAGLGRAADERDAWSALVSRHPSSPYLWRARQRLRQLGESPPP